MKPMFGSSTAGCTCIEPWTRREPRSTFISPRTGHAAAAQRFFCKALAAANHPCPRVINVDGNPSYPKVVNELKQERRLGRRWRCRTCPYLNHIIEQDHREPSTADQCQVGVPILPGGFANDPGYEVMHMIRKAQVRWLLKGNVIGQVLFMILTLERKTL